jgi:prolyl-tRNA synthetase
MLRTKLLLTIHRSPPHGAITPSHINLFRSSFFKPGTASGLFDTLPLGVRVMDKIQSIVKLEMDSIVRAQRLSMPSLMTPELWKKTDRYEKYGQDMFTLKDRKHSELLLSPTHEEAFTDTVIQIYGPHVPSKTLPLLLYQIGTKFRDEPRPRSGILRGREFLMKDLYTFHETNECAMNTYNKVCASYERLLHRLCPPPPPPSTNSTTPTSSFRKVIADSGNMGGTLSHEFQILSSSGEDKLLLCNQGTFANNVETTTLKPNSFIKNSVISYTTIESPMNKKYQIKIPSSRQISEIALQKYLSNKKSTTGQDLTTIIDADSEGLIEAQHGDPCTDSSCSCNGNGLLQEQKGIEVGHSFILGTRYSKALGVTSTIIPYSPLIMACYGLGISRLAAAVIEAHGGHDQYGIIWADGIAPFRVVVIPSPQAPAESIKQTFEHITNIFGIEDALLDDRTDVSFTHKMIDARLLGITYILVIRKDGTFELHPRTCNNIVIHSLHNSIDSVVNKIMNV